MREVLSSIKKNVPKSFPEWPAASPDLSPLDYFLRSEIKRQLSELEHPPKTEAEMRTAICVAAILVEQEKVNKAIGNLIRRCGKRLEVGGKRFDHML